MIADPHSGPRGPPQSRDLVPGPSFGCDARTFAPLATCTLEQRASASYGQLLASLAPASLVLPDITGQFTMGWHCDALDYGDHALPPPGARLPPRMRLCRYYKRVTGYEESKTGWRVRADDNTDSRYVLVPEGRSPQGWSFIIPGYSLTPANSLWESFSGLPANITTEYQVAIAAWREVGVDAKSPPHDFNHYLSRFYHPPEPTKALVAIFSASGPWPHGRLSIGAHLTPNEPLWAHGAGYFLNRPSGTPITQRPT